MDKTSTVHSTLPNKSDNPFRDEGGLDGNNLLMRGRGIMNFFSSGGSKKN